MPRRIPRRIPLDHLLTPTVRFWKFWRRSWVKLSLRPGQTLRAAFSERDEEGYGYEVEDYSYGRATDGQPAVLLEWMNGGRDCDGPIRRQGALACPASRLTALPSYDAGTTDHLFQHRPIRRPDWQKIRPDEIEDEFAIRAGY